jgi:diguanylate cyclase (GGDEF)-like protein
LVESVGVKIVVLTTSDEHVATINSALREVGHATHCERIDQPNDVDDALSRMAPDLVVFFPDDAPRFDIATVASQVARAACNPPLLLVRQRVDEQVIAADMESGARDVVSLTHKNRFVAVAERELQAQRMRTALDNMLSSASVYKRELRDLMDGASDAIADVQEGILVAANPAWLALFDYASEEDVHGLPIMDLYRADEHPAVKGALVACLKGKWNDESLHVHGRKADGGEIPMQIRLERTTLDGDPTVRVIVPIETPAEQSPIELLEQAVYKDPSTGFYHRHHFLEKLGERVATPLEGGVRAMVYIRPDNFARVHSDIGLLATESLLMRLAELLKEFMQPPDLYGRFGGTMFVALLERGNMGDVEAWAENLRKSIAEQVFEVDRQSTSLTCTIGLGELDQDQNSLTETLGAVEQACRQGRDAGGNRVQITVGSSASMTTRKRDELWVPRLRNALMQNRLRLVHQPVTGLNREIEGVFDTRVRLLDENDDLILPSEFMPAAERAGMAKNIDRWVIGASFSFCAAKRPNLVFVRLSCESVVDESLLSWLDARQQKARIQAGQICFQVTEDVAAQQLKRTKEVSEQLKAKGYKFAIDHLGTGRDSLQLIKHIPMDYTKIDGSLMQGLHRDQDSQKRVGDLAQAARNEKIYTIAERVEDAQTMAVLWQLGIAHIQGNYNQMHGLVLEDSQTVRGLSLEAAES